MVINVHKINLRFSVNLYHLIHQIITILPLIYHHYLAKIKDNLSSLQKRFSGLKDHTMLHGVPYNQPYHIHP